MFLFRCLEMHNIFLELQFGTPKVFKGISTSTRSDRPFKWMVRWSRGVNTSKHLGGTEPMAFFLSRERDWKCQIADPCIS